MGVGERDESQIGGPYGKEATEGSINQSQLESNTSFFNSVAIQTIVGLLQLFSSADNHTSTE